MIQYCLKGRGRVISVLVFVHTQVNLVFVHTHRFYFTKTCVCAYKFIKLGLQANCNRL